MLYDTDTVPPLCLLPPDDGSGDGGWSHAYPYGTVDAGLGSMSASCACAAGGGARAGRVLGEVAGTAVVGERETGEDKGNAAEKLREGPVATGRSCDFSSPSTSPPPYPGRAPVELATVAVAVRADSATSPSRSPNVSHSAGIGVAAGVGVSARDGASDIEATALVASDRHKNAADRRDSS